MAEYGKLQKCKKCRETLKRLVTAPNLHGLDSKIGVKGWGVAPPANSDKATEGF